MSKRDTDGGRCGRVSRRYDWGAVLPSTAVVETVAEAAGRRPLDVEPLFETVDADSLDEAVRSLASAPDSESSVSFHFAGYRVTVNACGLVAAEPR